MAIFILTKNMVGTEALTAHFNHAMKTGFTLPGVEQKMESIANDIYKMLDACEGDDASIGVNVVPGWKLGKIGVIVVASNNVSKMVVLTGTVSTLPKYMSKPDDIMHLYHLKDPSEEVMKMVVEGTSSF